MPKKVYRTAQGKIIDFDAIATQNEETIAIGNQKVNARGDQLGPGGKIVKTRAQVMEEYYKLNSPVATDTQITSQPTADEPEQVHPSHIDEAKQQANTPEIDAQAAEFEDAVEPQTPGSIVHHDVKTDTSMRGTLASAVAQTATVTQEPKLPLNKQNGVQRF
jgi:hypothetical protein